MAQRDKTELLTELAGLQLCGTPATILEQLGEWRKAMNPSRFVLSMRFGGMPYEVAERNIRTIARILPEVSRWPDSTD
jgi:alkanesulfonate monooxygenase SsuD/methylene tetrahydromethanopterin reductase-like flavin-dependent oxidoreductase (luciferase family)